MVAALVFSKLSLFPLGKIGMSPSSGVVHRKAHTIPLLHLDRAIFLSVPQIPLGTFSSIS